MPKPKDPEAVATAASGTASGYVSIGRVGKAHGLRGAFFVAGRSDPVPASYGELWIGLDSGVARPARVQSSLMQADRPLLVCSLAKNRSEAEALTGQLIFAERTRIKVRPEEMLWSELAGAVVVDSEGAEVGRVHHVYNAGSCDIIELRQGRRSVDIPLIDAYLQPGKAFVRETATLRLAVPKALFDDVWHDQTRRDPAEGQPEATDGSGREPGQLAPGGEGGDA